MNDNLYKQFDPQKQSLSGVSAMSGNYIFALREGAELPDVGIAPEYVTFNGLNVIYTGQTKSSLSNRLETHFQGIARRSTFRKSLGCLMGLRLIPYGDGKTSFSPTDEVKISDWMRRNIICYYLPNNAIDQVEQELIDRFSPPLNIQKTTFLHSNVQYRKILKQLRGNQ